MNDKELILKLGGPAKVAKLLGYEKHGQQRVTNWMARGIPAAVKVEHPHIFMRDALAKAKRTTKPTPQETTHA